jgi:hypothetical protein
MSYQRYRALSGDTSHGPAWYRAMGGVSTRFPARVPTRRPALGSLGDDAPAPTTLSTPTIADPTFQWQGDVLAQLRAGVETMKKAELQKWLQIIATVSIPLSAAIWRLIFRRGASDPTV